MKFVIAFFSTLMFSSVATIGQAPQAQSTPMYNANDPLTMISSDVARTAKAVESLARSWSEFTKTFSSNQGLLLDDQQRKLILALEVLNRLEVSMANMQKLRLDLTERQSTFRTRLASVAEDLQPQSIDRYVALRGTTDAEGLRTARRQTLEREYRDLAQLLQQIGRELASTDQEIRRLEVQLRSLRSQIFGETDRQLSGS